MAAAAVAVLTATWLIVNGSWLHQETTTGVAPVSDDIGVSFDTTTGRVYTVETKDDLVDTNDWQTLVGNVSGTGGRLEVVDGDNLPERNYRMTVRLDLPRDRGKHS